MATDKSMQRTCVHNDNNQTCDGLRTMGALGAQVGGFASPSPGFDLNLPVIYWRAVGTGVEARGGHAPEGATFEGRQDPMVPWNEPHPGP